jgi:hypothetical protein
MAQVVECLPRGPEFKPQYCKKKGREGGKKGGRKGRHLTI